MLLDNILPNALSIFAAPICFYHRLKHPQMVSFGLYASLKKMRKNKIIGEIDSIFLEIVLHLSDQRYSRNDQ